MIITAILTIIMIWCLFYNTIPELILIFLSIFLGILFAVIKQHKHEGVLHIDIIAQYSKLNKVNPSLKLWTVIILMFSCISSQSPMVGLILFVLTLFFTVCIGGLDLHDYIRLISVPIMFLLVSGLALLFNFGMEPAGIINIPIFHSYLYVSKASQLHTTLTLSKAIGAMSCLYLLSLSTPMPEIISVLRKAYVPGIVTELMYLIYRYIFLLFEMHRSMKDSAKSRMGYRNLSSSISTTGKIYTNLLARSYKKALQNFDAMESRCYTGEILFMENKKSIPAIHIIIASFSVVVMVVLVITLR